MRMTKKRQNGRVFQNLQREDCPDPTPALDPESDLTAHLISPFQDPIKFSALVDAQIQLDRQAANRTNLHPRSCTHSHRTPLVVQHASFAALLTCRSQGTCLVHLVIVVARLLLTTTFEYSPTPENSADRMLARANHIIKLRIHHAEPSRWQYKAMLVGSPTSDEPNAEGSSGSILWQPS